MQRKRSVIPLEAGDLYQRLKGTVDQATALLTVPAERTGLANSDLTVWGGLMAAIAYATAPRYADSLPYGDFPLAPRRSGAQA